MTNDEVIEALSDLRAKYNCFDDAERKQYHALSMAIKSLTTEAIPVEWIKEKISNNKGFYNSSLRRLLDEWAERKEE